MYALTNFNALDCYA